MTQKPKHERYLTPIALAMVIISIISFIIYVGSGRSRSAADVLVINRSGKTMVLLDAWAPPNGLWPSAWRVAGRIGPARSARLMMFVGYRRSSGKIGVAAIPNFVSGPRPRYLVEEVSPDSSYILELDGQNFLPGKVDSILIIDSNNKVSVYDTKDDLVPRG